MKKCHQLHVGRKNALCPKLKVDNWELKKVDEFQTGIENLEDSLVEDTFLRRWIQKSILETSFL